MDEKSEYPPAPEMAPEIVPVTNGPGVLITFEGGDGCGKSTQSEFLSRLMSEAGYNVVRVREPGGTLLGERLREILLDPTNETLSARSELLMYEAARAQLVHEVIAPAIDAGKVVLCDRFTDSTMAYQGYGRGLGTETVDMLNSFATESMVPDLTIMLHCSDRSAKRERVDSRNGRDRIELAGNDFHTAVIDAFLKLAEEEPERIVLIDTSGSHSETARSIAEAVSVLLPAIAADDDVLQAELDLFEREFGNPDDGACG